MPPAVVRADYAELARVAACFAQHAEQSRRMLQRVRSEQATLQAGDWLGQGAQAFYAEMNGQVVPTLNRLVRAMDEAQRVTLQVSRILKEAEDEAARCLRTNGNGAAAGGPAAAPKATVVSGKASGFAGAWASGSASLKMRSSGGLLSKVGSFFSSVGRHAGDFVVGAGKELFSIGKGVVLTVMAPAYSAYQTAKGLWHVANNPRAAWEAFKKPYVEAWKSGRPFEAIGRGYIFVGSLFVGGGEVKAGLEARHAADLARKAGRTADAASDAGRVSKASQVDDLLAKEQRDLAEMAKGGQTEALPKTNPMASPTRPGAEISADLARAHKEVAAVKDAAADLIRREIGEAGLGRMPPDSIQGHQQVQRILEDEVIAGLQEAARRSPADLQQINQTRANNGLKPVAEALQEAEAIRDQLEQARTRMGEAAAEDLQLQGNEVPWWRDD